MRNSMTTKDGHTLISSDWSGEIDVSFFGPDRVGFTYSTESHSGNFTDRDLLHLYSRIKHFIMLDIIKCSKDGSLPMEYFLNDLNDNAEFFKNFYEYGFEILGHIDDINERRRSDAVDYDLKIHSFKRDKQFMFTQVLVAVKAIELLPLLSTIKLSIARDIDESIEYEQDVMKHFNKPVELVLQAYGPNISERNMVRAGMLEMIDFTTRYTYFQQEKDNYHKSQDVVEFEHWRTCLEFPIF